MDIKQAKELYKMGVLSEMVITRDGENWLLVIVDAKGNGHTLQTVRGEDKVYSKMDTVVGDMEAICDKVSSLVFKL